MLCEWMPAAGIFGFVPLAASVLVLVKGLDSRTFNQSIKLIITVYSFMLKSYREYMAEAEVANDGPPAVNPRHKVSDVFGHLGQERGGILYDLNRIMTRMVDKHPGQVRRLLSSMLQSGDFDDEEDLKKQAKVLHEELTSGKVRSTVRMADRALKQKEPTDVVSRPAPDSPGDPVS